MKDYEYKEVIAMLTVIYKKLTKLDREVNKKNFSWPPDQWILDELREEARKLGNLT